ncbi:substrate-binding periplasmic protein [Paraglaciecola sp. 2405UD69-4]|uniref:substrate-binding periplasmic protein n=1 Tax=Paraglaciecola sp. 2405UD69-4 TaxID=3391836 RepID=UPI0039C8C29F
MQNTKYLLPCIYILLFFACKNVFASNTYLFAVNTPSAPPYLYIDPKSNTYIGLINDVAQEVTRIHKVKFKFIDSHRNRNEALIYSGKVDAFLLSRVWLQHPEKIIATIPLFSHRMFLYQMKPFNDSFTLADIREQSVCTRESYVYPSLTEMAESGIISRVDSRSQLSVMSMLVAGRCDYAIMNEFNAIKVFNSPSFEGHKIFRSPAPSDETHTEIILRPELTELKNQFDQTIAAMQKDGSLQKSLQHHVESKFPYNK